MPERNGRNDGRDLPRASLTDALSHLRRPPSPGGVRFKLQTVSGDVGPVAAYIDARHVLDRLDQVCGPDWSARFEPLPEQLVPAPVDQDGELRQPLLLFVRCRLTVFEVTREDVGEGHDPKAAFSDALKRAAVHFGIGRALYALPSPWLRAGRGPGELRRNRAGKLILDGRTEGWCRERYARWLEAHGQRQFGEPLDHVAAAGPALVDRRESQARRLDLQLVERRRRAAGYDATAVGQLASVLYRQPDLRRLSSRQAADLGQTLQQASSGEMDARLFARCVTRLCVKSQAERPLAIRAFRRYLADRSQRPARSATRAA